MNVTSYTSGDRSQMHSALIWIHGDSVLPWLPQALPEIGQPAMRAAGVGRVNAHCAPLSHEKQSDSPVRQAAQEFGSFDAINTSSCKEDAEQGGNRTWHRTAAKITAKSLKKGERWIVRATVISPRLRWRYSRSFPPRRNRGPMN